MKYEEGVIRLILEVVVFILGLLAIFFIWFNNMMFSRMLKEFKKTQGDSQQVKTAQRADKKRDHKILKILKTRKPKKDESGKGRPPKSFAF